MIQIFKNTRFILFVIVGIGALLRLYGLSHNPPHLTNDEAALGYNAYSVLKTGRDEHGAFLPIVFQSFGDWKPGLYVYATVPFVAALGLNELAVRLPSALAGIIAILLSFLIVCYLFNEKVAAASAFFLAISPWHLQFSRGAWEANLSLTLALLGIYAFLRAMDKERYWILLSAIAFASTLWVYQGAKLSTTLLVLGLILFFQKKLFKIEKSLLVKFVILGLLIALPVVTSMFSGRAGRLEVYSVFSYPRPAEVLNEILAQENISTNSPIYYLFHSEKLNFLRGVLGRWVNHYSGRFLFFEGDWGSTRHGVPNAGVILLADALFLILGFIVLSKLNFKPQSLFIWYWLLVAPMPAALSRDAVHAIRSLSLVIPLTVLLGLGVVHLLSLRERAGKFFIPLLTVIAVLYIGNFLYYLDQYWVHATKKNSQYWHYGYKQIVEKLKPIQGSYEEIVVKQDYSQPYIFFLFYQQYDPKKYQQMASRVFVPSEYGDVGLVSELDNVTFRDINWSRDRGMSGKLFVVDPIKVPVVDSSDPREFKQIDEVKFLNGRTAFRIFEIL